MYVAGGVILYGDHKKASKQLSLMVINIVLVYVSENDGFIGYRIVLFTKI